MQAIHLRTALRGGLQRPLPRQSPTMRASPPMSFRLSRRALLIGATTSVLAACSKDLQRDGLVAIAGADRQPDEPLWSALTNSFVIAVTAEGRRELHAMGSAYADLGSNGLIALANECTFSTAHLGRLAWCRPRLMGDSTSGSTPIPSFTARPRPASVFVCLQCASRWSQFGSVITGPSTQGLTFLTVSINGEDDVVIDKASRTPGLLAIPDSTQADIACDQTFAAPT